MSNHPSKIINIFIACLLGFQIFQASATESITPGGTMKNPMIRYEYTENELTRLCETAIQAASQQIDSIVKTAPSDRTLENTLLAFEEAMSQFHDTISPLTFMAYVSTNAANSKEASRCEEKVNQFGVSIMTRKDLYLAIKDQKATQPAEARLLSETLKAFEENGLKLPDDKLKQVRELKQALAVLESQFSTNLNQDQTVAEFTREELAGVPEDYINSLHPAKADPKATGKTDKLTVSTKEPDYVRIMDNATLATTRRQMLEAYENRANPKNTQLLEEAIRLRQKIASLLTYDTWADYRTSTRMAKDSKTVTKFLNELKGKLSQRNSEDLGKLLDTKKKKDPTDTELYPWDIRYLTNQYKKENLSLDDEKIREYFPADRVVKGLFEVYSKLLGVQYIEEKDAKTWAKGVHLYRVVDTKDQHLIGYFYADFFPRDGKYGHAAAFTLISGKKTKTGYTHPISSIVANFTPSENGKPSLLKHEEVRTIFHEFGHIMHQTLTQAPYASLSGSSVDQDFVEAPSQMLENWVFSKEILTLLSGHYLDPKKKLPTEWIDKIIEARDFNQGYFYTRQLFLASLDMTYHTTSGSVDTTKVFQKLYKDVMSINPAETSHFQASFGHLMGGYDAGYYGYLWSEVYAADMFSRFEKEGMLNSKVGLEYRKAVLEPGKMHEGFEILENFLGRKPNPQAFYKNLHIEKL
ncbi:MAG: M3 family metallopeptidase [Bdellovibrionia bacterium]